MTNTTNISAQHQEAIVLLTQEFSEVYGGDTADLSVFFAPGRVNFMGDHIDYCGGKVLPAAIKFGTYLAVRKKAQPATASEPGLHFHSINNHKPATTRTFDASKIAYAKQNGWANYPLGVISEYQKLSADIPAAEFLFYGNMPSGAALSSSASVLLVTAFAVQHLADFRHHEDDYDNRRDCAFLCHRSEVGFNKLNCGTMDQAAVALGREGHALLLDCVTLDCEYIKPNWGDYRLLIVNSAKPRQLQNTAYNERREEANRCLELVHREFAVENLCDLASEDYDEALKLIQDNGDPVLHKRARHILSETARVGVAAECLASGDMQKFGELLNLSHESLRHDYEVTGLELNTLVDGSRAHEAVIGARMTGGGFTGCTLTLVQKDAVADYQEYIKKLYNEKTSLNASFVPADPGAGVERLI